jgi:hypothetical protein
VSIDGLCVEGDSEAKGRASHVADHDGFSGAPLLFKVLPPNTNASALTKSSRNRDMDKASYRMIIVARTSACIVEPRADSHLVGRNMPSPGAAMHDCPYAFGDRHRKVSSLRLLSTTSSLQKVRYLGTSEPHQYSWLLRSPQSRHRLCLEALALPLEYKKLGDLRTDNQQSRYQLWMSCAVTKYIVRRFAYSLAEDDADLARYRTNQHWDEFSPLSLASMIYKRNEMQDEHLLKHPGNLYAGREVGSSNQFFQSRSAPNRLF